MCRTSHVSAMHPLQEVRMFVALPLGEGVARSLTHAISTLKPIAGESWRWVSENSLHITLRFLGLVPASHIQMILGACQEAARYYTPLNLSVSGLGMFPNQRNPRVLWAGLAGDTQLLTMLYRRLDKELVKAGFPPAHQPYSPHITLARCKPGLSGGQVDLLAHGAAFSFSWTAHEIVLYRSDLHPQGARYTDLGRVPLAGASAH